MPLPFVSLAYGRQRTQKWQITTHCSTASHAHVCVAGSNSCWNAAAASIAISSPVRHMCKNYYTFIGIFNELYVVILTYVWVVNWSNLCSFAVFLSDWRALLIYRLWLISPPRITLALTLNNTVRRPSFKIALIDHFHNFSSCNDLDLWVWHRQYKAEPITLLSRPEDV